MTNNATFADVKVGDRVRLTGNGEVHEVEVKYVAERRDALDTATGYCFHEIDGWDIEILEKPLPTGEYAVIGSRTQPSHEGGFYLESGVWRTHDGEHYTEGDVRRYMRKWNLEVLFEGVQK